MSAKVASAAAASSRQKVVSKKLCWLDLRGMGLSMLERLSLEEALLRHDDRNWAIVGTHTAWPHKYLRSPQDVQFPHYMSTTTALKSLDCMIIMGIGGKPENLLNIPLVKDEQVMVIKRFSGGGTVVLDTNSLWTTLIGRTQDFPNVEPYPRSIMEWSANDVFIPTFERMQAFRNDNTLVPETRSCTATVDLGKMVQRKKKSDDSFQTFPKFELRENDYVFGDKKVGGNAQSIVKGGWLHHTSFLWDFDSHNMQYLTLPDKRPDYRGDRSHDDFLVRLSEYYGRSHRPFVTAMKEACDQNFQEVETKSLSQVMDEVIIGKLGGMNTWFAKNRTRIIDDF